MVSVMVDRRVTRGRGWLPAVVLLLALVTAAAHAPALDAEALAPDDHQYLINNPLVRHPSWDSARRFVIEVLNPSTVGGYYQPLAMISLMLDVALGGRPDQLRPFHRTSLLLHVINTSLIMVLLHRMLRRSAEREQVLERPLDGRALATNGSNSWAVVGSAALTALIFGVHPLTVEPIPWVGERKTLLATMFALLSLIAYVGPSDPARFATERPAPGGGRRRIGAALGFYLLALMSKPTSTPLPLAMLLMDVWPLRRVPAWPPNRAWGRAIIEKLPLLALGIVSAVVTYRSQSATYVQAPSQQGWSRISMMLCHNVAFYLGKILWPADLSAFYAFPEPLSPSHPTVLAGLILTPLLFVALILVARRWTAAPLVGAMIFFTMIFPTLGVIGFTVVVASDKYVYLPAIGLLLPLAAGLRAALAEWVAPLALKQVVLAAGLVVIAAEFAVTRATIRPWRSTEALYQHMLIGAPRAAKLHFGLGHHYEYTGQPAKAVACYERALACDPEDRDARLNLAGLLLDAGRPAEALAQYSMLEALRSDDAALQNNLGLALRDLGRLDEAVQRFQRALTLDPSYAPALTNLGGVLGRQGRLDDSIVYFRRALELDPGLIPARMNLAFALQQRGAAQAAADQYRDVLARQPGHAGALAALRALEQQTGPKP
ncbi:MAG: hypothetical protein DCC66_02100 [Planctomycetota bacterium]|nr:MAG: hypothetical protein DCC66_02100 [Planctomycetota bacterium]